MKAKLPPTDSRLRQDVKFWENHDLESANAEKDRLESNQAERLRMKQEEAGQTGNVHLGGLPSEEEDDNTDVAAATISIQDLYEPRFFNKICTLDEEGNKVYSYTPKGNKYWEDRERGNWDYVPRIFDDSCEGL